MICSYVLEKDSSQNECFLNEYHVHISTYVKDQISSSVNITGLSPSKISSFFFLFYFRMKRFCFL